MPVIKDAIQLFIKADFYLDYPKLQLGSIAGELTDLLNKDLKALMAKIANIQFKKEDEVLWLSIYICLEALHQHVYNKIPKFNKLPRKETDGTYARIDLQDRVFHSMTGQTKYGIAVYYHEAALIFEEKLKAFNAPPQPEQPMMPGAEEDSIKIIAQDDKITTCSVSIPNESLSQFRLLCAEFLKNPDEVMAQFQAHSEIAAVHKGWLELETVKEKRDDAVKIDKLHNLYLQFGLTEELESALTTLGDGMKAQCESYKNSYKAYYNFFPRAHASIASDIITSIDSPDSSPNTQLALLFNIRNELTGKNSGDLLIRINGLLLLVFENILTRLQHLQPKTSLTMS